MGAPLLYNIDFESAAIVFLIVINIFVRLKYVTKSEVNQEFRKLALFVLMACVLDVTTAITSF